MDEIERQIEWFLRKVVEPVAMFLLILLVVSQFMHYI